MYKYIKYIYITIQAKHRSHTKLLITINYNFTCFVPVKCKFQIYYLLLLHILTYDF